MSALLDRYIFTLIHETAGTRRVYPVQEDAITLFTKEQDQLFFRESIKDDILLTKADFDWLYAIEQSAGRCGTFQITIELITSGSPDIFTGNINLDLAFFEPDFCRVTLKVDSTDSYSTLYKIWEKPVNILGGTPKVASYTNFKNIPHDVLTTFELVETEEDIELTFGVSNYDEIAGVNAGWEFTNPDFPDTSQGWYMVADAVTTYDPGPPDAPHVVRKTKWRREITTATYTLADPVPEGGSWDIVDVVGLNFKYARLDQTTYNKENSTSEILYWGSGIFLSTYLVYNRIWLYMPFDHVFLDNGVRLEDAFVKLLNGTGLAVKSNLFNINPTGPSPSNDVYGYVNIDVREIVLYEISDIKLPEATEAASILNVTLKAMFERLINKFQAYPTLEGSTIILEHISFYEEINGLDFTVSPYAVSLLGKAGYRYDKRVPSSELWYDLDGDKYKYQIYYDVPAVNPNDDAPPDEVDWSDYVNCLGEPESAKSWVSEVYTRIEEINANPADYPEFGMVIVHTFIYQDDIRQIYGGRNDGFFPHTLNCRMQADQCARTFFVHRRYFLNYITDNYTGAFPAQFLSLIPYKEQVPLQFKIPSLGNAPFEILKRQKTQLGWGEVKTAEYSRKTGTLTLQLLHQ